MAFLSSMDKPGWWWVQHTCNEAYKLEPEVTEEVAREAMEEASFGYIVDQRWQLTRTIL